MGRAESVMRTVVGADFDPPLTQSPTPRSPPAAGSVSHTSVPARPSAATRWVLALLLFGLLLGAGGWWIAWLLAPQHMTLARVRIEGELRHTNRAVFQRILAEQASGSFFALDLIAIRQALEAMPWIAYASVRRVWPLALAVRVREREALAHWGDRSLVSPEGEVFTPDVESVPKGLVQLRGPNGSAPEVVRRYRWLQGRLAAHGLTIAQMNLSARHAWYLELEGGLRLSLGTQELEAHVERFLDYLPRLPQPAALEQVDLRYANGFAVHWRAPLVVPTGPKTVTRRMGRAKRNPSPRSKTLKTVASDH